MKSQAKFHLIEKLKTCKEKIENPPSVSVYTNPFTYVSTLFKSPSELSAINKFLFLLEHEGEKLSEGFDEYEAKALSNFFRKELHQFFEENPSCKQIVMAIKLPVKENQSVLEAKTPHVSEEILSKILNF